LSGTLFFVVLLVGAAACVLTAIELFAAAADHRYHAWSRIPAPDSHAARIGALVGLMLLFAVVMSLAVRRSPGALTFATTSGTLTVPEKAVSALVSKALAGDDDVLTSEARVRSRGGAIEIDCSVVLRPLSDETIVGQRVRGEVSDALEAATGAAPTIRRLRTRVATVHDLPRYL
jgi:hypothetical protein